MIRRIALGLALAVALLSFGTLARAETCTAAACTWIMTWVEPSTVQGGGALTNLTKTTLYIQVGAGAATAFDVPATKPGGGGTVTQQVSVPVAVGQKANIQAWATATNTYGASPNSAIDAWTKDRTSEYPPAAPGAPTHQ